MHDYCSTCINILVISLSLAFSLSHLTLPLASLSVINITTVARRTPSINITPLPPISIKPHAAWSNRCWSLSLQSPFFSFDQDQTIVADELADQDQTTTADQHQTIATQSLIKLLPITLPLISVFLIWSRSNHCRRWTRWLRSNHYHQSTSNHCHTKPDQIAAGHLTDFLLFD